MGRTKDDSILTPPVVKEPPVRAITARQRQVLDFLAKNGPSRLCDICKETGIKTTQVFGILKSLHMRDLVRKDIGHCRTSLTTTKTTTATPVWSLTRAGESSETARA